MESLPKTDAEWRKILSPEVYQVTRAKGTEPAFTGQYLNEHAKGVYRCSNCGAELFSSTAKFDSVTGWPSFDDPVAKEAVKLASDDSHGMRRTEAVCAKCGAHLGHVFDDGPKATTGKRYCVNSLSLNLEKEK